MQLHTKQNNMKLGTVLIVFLFASYIVKGTDSTLLYQTRIQKIKLLYDWLSTRPYENVNSIQPDTASGLWKSYDTVLNVFFDRKRVDSLFQWQNKQDDIFELSMKLRLLKQAIAALHQLSFHKCFEELKFKTKGQNTIIQYFVINEIEFESSGFQFLDNSSMLIGMPTIGFPEAKYRIYKQYYDTNILSSKKNCE